MFKLLQYELYIVQLFELTHHCCLTKPLCLGKLHKIPNDLKYLIRNKYLEEKKNNSI